MARLPTAVETLDGEERRVQPGRAARTARARARGARPRRGAGASPAAPRRDLGVAGEELGCDQEAQEAWATRCRRRGRLSAESLDREETAQTRKDSDPILRHGRSQSRSGRGVQCGSEQAGGRHDWGFAESDPYAAGIVEVNENLDARRGARED